MGFLKITNTKTGKVEYDSTNGSCNIRRGLSTDGDGNDVGPFTHDNMQFTDETQLQYYKILLEWYKRDLPFSRK